MKLGIDKLRVYPSTLALRFDALCAARGHEPGQTVEHLLVAERSVMPPWEDSVTMAVNAAAPLLDDEDRSAIGLVIVGTETPVDLEKPISSWVHRLLGLPSTCRNFDTKHACYSVTAAMQMALAWLASPAGAGKKALVVGTDASLVGIGEAYEYVLGAGAVALVLSQNPGFLQVELGRTGIYASEVTDVIRPSRRIETGSSDSSLLSYLEAVDGAYDAYIDAGSDVDFESEFAHCIYHAPFGGITFRAHKMLLARGREISRAQAWSDFERRSLPGLCHLRRTGGVYGGSTFVSLLGMMDARPELKPGDRVSVFSFGSGSCAEFYAACIGPEARAVAACAGLTTQLDERLPISVAQYEELEQGRAQSVDCPDVDPYDENWADHFTSCWEGRHRCALSSVSQWRREYVWT